VFKFYNPITVQTRLAFINDTMSHQTDVIIVLGAAVWAGGVPSPALRRRVLHAVDLLRHQRSNVLIVSGGLGKYPPSEAQIMKRLAIEQGISESKIVMEESARSTLDSAVACARILRKNQWSRALLVTGQYHIIRSFLLFRLLGVAVVCSTPKLGGFGPRQLKWWAWHFREFMALLWSLLRYCARKAFRL